MQLEKHLKQKRLNSHKQLCRHHQQFKNTQQWQCTLAWNGKSCLSHTEYVIKLWHIRFTEFDEHLSNLSRLFKVCLEANLRTWSCCWIPVRVLHQSLLRGSAFVLHVWKMFNECYLCTETQTLLVVKRGHVIRLSKHTHTHTFMK